MARDVTIPEHREIRGHELALARQVQPDLEKLERVVALALDEREHLRVDDACPGGEPLHVTRAEARRRAERIRMVDEPATRDGHGLEAAVGVLGEARNDV